MPFRNYAAVDYNEYNSDNDSLASVLKQNDFT